MRRAVPVFAALAALAGCAPMPDVGVRHVASTETYGADARFHLFLFDPAEPRPFGTRLSLARDAARRDPDCRWVDAPEDVLRARTADQGAAYAERVIVAPLVCA